MDPWKIATAGLGTLSVVLIGAVAYLVSQAPAPVSAEPETVAAAGEQSASSTMRTESAIDRNGRSTEQVPLSLDGVAPATARSQAWVNDPAQPLPEAIMERARTQLRAERQDRRAERRDEIRDDIDAFLDDEGIDPATADKVHGALDTFGDKMSAIRDQVRSGEIDRGDARQIFRDGREELTATLDDLLGEDVAARLQENLPGRGGPPGGGGGPGLRRGGGL